MTIRELRNEIFYRVKDQDQEIDIDDVIELIGLWNRHMGIRHKIVEEIAKEHISNHLSSESADFVLGRMRENEKCMEMIREYKANKG